jgi:TerC family integral membrane protein
MTEIDLFPFHEYWWVYIAFLGFVLLLLVLDLGIFHRKAHEVSIREATVWSIVWVCLALFFNLGFYHFALQVFRGDPRLMGIPGFDPHVTAERVSLEFLTGYIVEKSLAVDNIFVFVVVFSFFAIPGKYQHRVLFYGIIGALFFRALFIGLGSVLMSSAWVVIVFGAFLIFTGVKIFFAPEKGIDPDKNPIIRLFKRFVPVTNQLQEERFFIRLGGVIHATPLFIALLFIEVSDIIFAVDSVPAIFALTREPLIVFTSNIFAICGLRSMYFLLAGAYSKFYALKYGLGVVLVFVGLKMVLLNDLFGGKFPIEWSLGIITGVIAISIAISLLFPQRGFKSSSSGRPTTLPD